MKALANESGYKILCGDDSVGVILHGTKGDSGVPGANAESCTLSDDGNGIVNVICTTDTATLYKAVCGTEPYDPAKSFCSNDGSKNEIVALCGGEFSRDKQVPHNSNRLADLDGAKPELRNG